MYALHTLAWVGKAPAIGGPGDVNVECECWMADNIKGLIYHRYLGIGCCFFAPPSLKLLQTKPLPRPVEKMCFFLTRF